MPTRRRHEPLPRVVAAAAAFLLAALAPALSRTAEPGIAFHPTVYSAAVVSTTYLGNWHFGSVPYCNDEGWTTADLTAGVSDYGDVAGLVFGVAHVTLDPCYSDLGCVWGFLAGSTATYACGGYPIEPAVPYGDETTGYLANEIRSPAVPITGDGSAFWLRFNVYRDLDLDALVFYTVRIRSIKGETVGPWRGRDVVYYGPSRPPAVGDWFTQVASIGDLVDLGADSLQVALGVVDMAGVWGGLLGSGACHSNAPFFDDVALFRLSARGPQWFVDPVDLFQDNFSADGTVTGTVRVDMARDINPRTNPAIRPGDSLVVSVDEPTVGLAYDVPGDPTSGPAVYLHVGDVSAVKSGDAVTGDATRWPVVDHAGGWTTLRMDSVRTGTGAVVPGRFCVDLNDDLYTPGDTIRFYMSARDAAGRVTTYVGDGGDAPYGKAPASLEMTCLPAAALTRGGHGILYVDDADGFGSQPFWDAAFDAVGVSDAVDRFDVRGPDRAAGNGLGSRVVDVTGQLVHFYDRILWCSGTLPHATVGNGTGVPEKSPDAQVLAEYLDALGNRGGLYLSGDHVAEGLESPEAGGLSAFIEHHVLGVSPWRTWGSPAPLVIAAPGGFFDHPGADTMLAYGGCPVVNGFDVFEPLGTAMVEMSYLRPYAPADPNAAVISQRTTNALGYPVTVILSGFAFDVIYDDRPTLVLDRFRHLHDVLDALTHVQEQPCVQSVFDSAVREASVHLTWRVDIDCLDLRSLRVYRTAPGDPGEVMVYENLAAPGGGTFDDDYHVPGTRVTYRLAGMRYGVETTLGTTEAIIPSPLFLGQNAPNPFNPATTIPYAVRTAGPVRIDVFDASGAYVATVVNTQKPPGRYQASWDGRTASGAPAASGVYFYRMTTRGDVLTRKMVIVR